MCSLLNATIAKGFYSVYFVALDNFIFFFLWQKYQRNFPRWDNPTLRVWMTCLPLSSSTLFIACLYGSECMRVCLFV